MSATPLLLAAALVLSGCGSQVTTTAPSPSPKPSPTGSASAVASPTSSSTTIPLGRWAAAMAYDTSRHTLVLFGGLNGADILDDTWTWNGSIWTHRQGLTANPPARQGASMAYDDVKRQVILFGGVGRVGVLNDTWSWDGSGWQPLRPAHAPSPRGSAAMAFDPALSAIVLFGGIKPGGRPTPINETWVWTGGDWIGQQPALSPAGGVQPRLAFLAGRNVLLRFGDCGVSRDPSFYAFDGHTWTALPRSGAWPPAVCLPVLAGDPSRRQLLVFGGTDGTNPPPAPQTWIYDGAAWRNANPAQSPSARYDAAMVFDPDHRNMVLFGGQGLGEGQSGPLNDTWTWDGARWTEHQ